VRAILEGPVRAWPLEWGINLVGTDPECEIALPARSGAPPFAAVLVRWMDFVVCLGIGEPPALIIGDRRIMYRKLAFQPLRPRESHELRFGSEKLTLRWEAVQPPSEDAVFGEAQMEDVLRGAVTLAGKTVKPLTGMPGEVGPLLAKMTGARLVPTGGPVKPGATVAFKSPFKTWADRSVSLVWDGAAPEASRVESLSADLAHVFDEACRARKGLAGTADQPCYRDITVRLPHLAVPVGPYGLLDPDDFAHLRLPAGTVRDPHLLVTTIAGRIEFVDLSPNPTLTIDGTRKRRGRVQHGQQFTIFDQPVTVEAGGTTETTIPDRIFRTLALPTDPIATLARLGLLLPQLLGAEDRRLAYLLAAQSTLRAAGVGLGARRPDGTNVYGPALLRFPQGGIERSPFDRCVLLDRAVQVATLAGGKFVAQDASQDHKLVTEPAPGAAAVPPDRRVPVWGPVAVLGGDELAPILVVWKAPGDLPFTATELHFLNVLRAAAAGDRLAKIEALQEPAPTDRGAAPASSLWLRWNRLQVPLGQMTLVGRSPSCDVSLLYDKSVSGRHALLVRDGDSVRLMDFRSTNGVRVNDQKVEEAVLNPGDLVAIGGMRLVFRKDEQPGEQPGPGADAYLTPGAEHVPDPALVGEVEALLEMGRLVGNATELRARLPAVVQGLAKLLRQRVCVVEAPPKREDLELVVGAPVPPGGDLLVKLAPLVQEALSSGGLTWSTEPDALAVPLKECTSAVDARWALVVLRDVPCPAARIEAAALAVDPLLARGPGAWVAGADLELPLLVTGGRIVPVTGPIWIGRGPECGLRIESDDVSRRHALAVPTDEAKPRVRMLDFKSSRGLVVAGAASNEAILADGDSVKIAGTEIKCRIPPGAAPPHRRKQAGVLRWAAGLATAGFQLGSVAAEARAETVAGLVRDRLDALRVQVVELPGGRVIASATDAAYPAARDERDADDLRGRVLAHVAQSKRALVQSVTEAEIYRRHVGTMPMLLPLAERSWLIVAALITSLRQPAVAFDRGALAVVAALLKGL
jgi:pSer/pThr/pTyr-binding forkhead associated (FHA) protein